MQWSNRTPYFVTLGANTICLIRLGWGCFADDPGREGNLDYFTVSKVHMEQEEIGPLTLFLSDYGYGDK